MDDYSRAVEIFKNSKEMRRFTLDMEELKASNRLLKSRIEFLESLIWPNSGVQNQYLREGNCKPPLNNRYLNRLSRTTDRRSICFTCGKAGHISRFCWNQNRKARNSKSKKPENDLLTINEESTEVLKNSNL